MRTERLERLLLRLEAAAAVLVLITAFGSLQRLLRAIGSTLGRIDMGVRAIEQQISLTGPALDRLDGISEELEARTVRPSENSG